MNTRRTFLLYFAAVILTVALVLLRPLLPEKRYRLLPELNAKSYVTDDREIGGNSQARFLDAKMSRIHCSMKGESLATYCGIGVVTSTSASDWSAGIDLSTYSAVEIKFRYRGPAEKIRLFLRNFDKNLSNVDDYNSAKYSNTFIRRIDFESEIRMKLSEFRVADWWLDQFKIPHRLATPSFDRVTNLGVEFFPPPLNGEHYIEIEKFHFVGDYVASEHWYLAILSLWLLGILCNLTLYMRNLKRGLKRDAHRAVELASYADALKHQNDIYKNLPNTDALTGALNRFGIMEIIDMTCKWLRNDDAVAIILLALDHPEIIRDQANRQTADRLLQAVSALLRQHTRSFDSIARWGEDEFLLFCPHTKLETARHLAEKIRIQIQQLNLPESAHSTLTASIGITQIRYGENVSDAFKRAAAALHKAKLGGHDRAVVHQSAAE